MTPEERTRLLNRLDEEVGGQMIKFAPGYFDHLLGRHKFTQASDGELQQMIRVARLAERVAPTVDDADELMVVSERAKDELAGRYPIQGAR